MLPFENLSEDKENAYLADGVQNEILTDLARIEDLKVISRTSVMIYQAGERANLRRSASNWEWQSFGRECAPVRKSYSGFSPAD